MKRLFFCLVFFVSNALVLANQPVLNHLPTPPANNANNNLFFGLYFGPTVDWLVPTSGQLERDAAKGGVIGGVNIDISLDKKKYLFFSTGLCFRYLQGAVSFENQYDILNTILVRSTVRYYEIMYLSIPTGVKFRSSPMNGCVFVGKLGLLHNFKIGGKQFDSFFLPQMLDKKYLVTTEKGVNNDIALFAESGFLGFGFEYAFKNHTRVAASIDYSCQFNYFSPKAKSNISEAKFKGVVHSLHIVLGFLF